jgi:hypothetical protein
VKEFGRRIAAGRPLRAGNSFERRNISSTFVMPDGVNFRIGALDASHWFATV